jgi:hypothetical protein
MANGRRPTSVRATLESSSFLHIAIRKLSFVRWHDVPTRCSVLTLAKDSNSRVWPRCRDQGCLKRDSTKNSPCNHQVARKARARGRCQTLYIVRPSIQKGLRGDPHVRGHHGELSRSSTWTGNPRLFVCWWSRILRASFKPITRPSRATVIRALDLPPN